ncbi:MAG: RluA family pseudouridine synthase [Cytophagaceae bacterium]|nr:RluA family pseudouridine synthase [Cytophagaceae bacterium]MBK9933631.1 RluA family pseudouridine synthase [Cytophagaceae bacterium]MBL0302655.1 RluA family pseudouridine synthase [Cytophagaceae bacterium]MBL0325479.1 RluA family pseudouridine synthase [Cytophagaceae bacterium]
MRQTKDYKVKFSQKKKGKPADLKLEVEKDAELLIFLLEKMPHKSRNDVKVLLRDKHVFVENKVISQFNQPIKTGQKVEIRWEKPPEEQRLRGLKIVFEDQYLIVIEKEAGVLSMATEKQKENTAYSVLSEYVKKADPANRIFIVHRLDKDTSGIMMYAKSEKIQKVLQENWNENILERTYLAVVEGNPKEPNGTIISYLVESKALIVYSTKNPEKGQMAVTHYETFKASKSHSLLKVNLETGRKNQIRVHMQDLGHPVIGDAKYGATTNPIKRLGLHAWVLSFTHPITKEAMRFETEIPKVFLGLF